MNQQAHNVLTARIIWNADDTSTIRIDYFGKRHTVTQEQNPEGTYLGAIRFLGVDLPHDYRVDLLATSALFTW